MAQKPSIPKGMRDFSPTEVAKRTYIFDTIKSVFRIYGYKPIETPTMENLSTLMGKYGDEGDKLLFKVLNSGDFMKDADRNEENPAKLATQICEKGLRYDLTVPFARYVVQHRNEITFPFKRFQIQPVWRADRPQKGRYREFYQCDVDVVGSNSLVYEAELVHIVGDVFSKLGINVVLKINNRKVLYGIAETIGFPEKMMDITVAIDKLDKIGIDAVNDELLERGLTQDAVDKLKPILNLSGSNSEKINQLRTAISSSETGLKGVDELEEIFTLISHTKHVQTELDLSLARGLSYYTGAIFEVKALDHAIGSISGGGRYDNLTGIFGLEGVSGVGISFGADRIYDVMEALQLFPSQTTQTTQLLVANFESPAKQLIIPIVQKIREAGISVELYPSPEKLKKQFDYAISNNIKHMLFIGDDEIASGNVTLKNLDTSEQKTASLDEILEIIS